MDQYLPRSRKQTGLKLNETGDEKDKRWINDTTKVASWNVRSLTQKEIELTKTKRN